MELINVHHFRLVSQVQYIVKILYNANFMAIHAGRVKLVSVDIAFITYLLDNLPNPYTPILDDIQTEL